jgi:hypothetical protein
MSAVDKAALREANARAHRIRAGIASYLTTLADVAAAYRERDWHTLGYADWSAYVEGEFSAQRMRLTPEHRQKAVEELRLAGLSQRAIGTALGVSQETVRRDLSGDSNVSPDAVRGIDGKVYPTQTRPSPMQAGTGPGETADVGVAAAVSPLDRPETGEAHAGLDDALLVERRGVEAGSDSLAGDGEAGRPDTTPASPQTATDVPISSVDGPVPNRHAGPAAGPTSPGPAVTPPRWDPDERRAHTDDVLRRQDIDAAHRTATTIVTSVRSQVATVLTGCRYGERGLVTKQMVSDLYDAIDLLGEEINGEMKVHTAEQYLARYRRRGERSAKRTRASDRVSVGKNAPMDNANRFVSIADCFPLIGRTVA